MKFNIVKEELSMLLENLTEQFEMMDTHQETIPQIELDIFMRNIQKLYENAIYLKRFKQEEEASLPIVKEVKEIVDEQIEEKIEIEPKDEAISEAQEIQAKQEVEEIEEEIVAEIKLDIPAHIESSFDDILEDQTESTNLFSNVKVSQEISDLNEKLAEARGAHTLVEKLQNQRIESLKSVIGVNDKFYFINELFNGDTKKYNDVIYTLNNFKKCDEAMQYFSTLKYRFSWDEESEAFGKLTQMIERKFSLIDA
ncbi:MAG: hypothetical protein GQ527_05945 [Bacteroidales bacterium]|nr:hypothetical protein [Bacteroidales bacterium]